MPDLPALHCGLMYEGIAVPSYIAYVCIGADNNLPERKCV